MAPSHNAAMGRSLDLLVRQNPYAAKAAQDFTKALSKALSVWVQANPPKDGATVADMMQADGPYNVFVTLDEDADDVGLLDGRWDQFYDNTRKMEQFLARAIGYETANLKAALDTGKTAAEHLLMRLAADHPDHADEILRCAWNIEDGGQLRDDSPQPGHTPRFDGHVDDPEDGSQVPPKRDDKGNPIEQYDKEAQADLWGRAASRVKNFRVR